MTNVIKHSNSPRLETVKNRFKVSPYKNTTRFEVRQTVSGRLPDFLKGTFTSQSKANEIISRFAEEHSG